MSRPVLIQVPITYGATGRKSGNNINSSLSFQEMLDIEVEAVSRDECPMVASWDDLPPSMCTGRSWQIGEGAEREHVRLYKGDYWRPVRWNEVSERRDAHTVDLSEFAPLVKGGMHKGVFPIVRLTPKKFISSNDYFENVSVSNRRLAVSKVEEAVGNLLFVDGSVYTRCLEPIVLAMSLSFEPAGFFQLGGVLRIVNRITDLTVFREAVAFPLGEYKEALRSVRRQNSFRGNLKQQLDTFNLGKQPELSYDFPLAAEDVAASRCAVKLRQFLSALEAERKLLLPLDDTVKLRMYCDLRDALEAMPSEAAMDTVETVGQAYLARYVVGYPNMQHGDGFLREAVTLASERTVDLVVGTNIGTLTNGR